MDGRPPAASGCGGCGRRPGARLARVRAGQRGGHLVRLAFGLREHDRLAAQAVHGDEVDQQAAPRRRRHLGAQHPVRAPCLVSDCEWRPE
jgi:hypothetical protein